ncbi:FecCD family ABC transporter permease [Corynebacterium kroppenstedtii]|uniref:FecCD family ABC transporter permease n=1 Tax=Corynebacterium sp. PCR 32 TaxID=3351342 RepID=UPI0030A30CEC
MRLHVRRIAGLFVLVVLLALCLCGAMALGSRDIPLTTVWDVVSHLGSSSELSDKDTDTQVILDLRIPRALLGVIVGMALGCAGALIQGHTRNPLADPGILGVSAGAACAVVASFAFLGVTGNIATMLWAFGGAIGATALVFGLASVGKATASPLNLVLGGAALAAVLSSLTSALVLTDNENLDRMRFWTVGAIAGRDMDIVVISAPVVAIALVAAFATGPTLNLLNLGDDAAASLGVHIERSRIMGVVLIALLAGAATAAAGPLGFVGLVVPHVVRSITGPDYRWILPYSALTGAVLVLVADIVGRLIARPGEVEVGIVLAFVGAPFFIYLISRNKVVEV